MTKNILMVALGGAAGSLLRFFIQKIFSASHFPVGTLLANLTGCLLIGIFWGFTARNLLAEPARLLLMTGFCGGFTTFSSFSYESMELLLNRKWMNFVFYSTISLIGGLIATFIGFRLTNNT